MKLPLNDTAPDTLDPTDWNEFRQVAHRMLDEAIDYVMHVRERPVWQPVPAAVKAHLAEPIPAEGSPLEAVCSAFRTDILPYATGNVHPRFLGWVHGSGQPGNIVADLLASAMNANCGGRDHGAIYVEHQVVDWCKQIFSFPSEASGVLLSGTSMANMVALGAARHAADPFLRTNGLSARHNSLVAFASSETHESIAKALDILGLGSTALRIIPVNSDFTIRIDALKAAIAEERTTGRQPFCVIGCAATVNTGAIDDLDQLASLCAAENLWFHVDGAFGALCMLSDRLRTRLKGIERADSLAFDFHKWMHVQYDAACVLVRRGDLHRAAYSMRPPYLESMPRGLAGGANWPCDFGPELSRGFRALKVWFAFRQHGTHKLGRLIEQNCAQAQYLGGLVSREPELEILAPATLNILCFRYRHADLTERETDRLNESIVEDLQERGIAAPSTTRIGGQLAIRVNITNHRTTNADLDFMLNAILENARLRLASAVSQK